MSGSKNSEFMRKVFWFCLGGVIYLALVIALMFIFYKYGSGFLLLYMPVFIFGSSLVGVLIWWNKFRDIFDSILIYITYVCFGFAFVFLVPFAVERSLSTFILFYAVQNNYFPELKISQEYKDAFFEKRVDDAIKGNFLSKDEDGYKPTMRTKVYYNILYPLGKATNMLGNYEKFEQEVNQSYTQK